MIIAYSETSIGLKEAGFHIFCIAQVECTATQHLAVTALIAEYNCEVMLRIMVKNCVVQLIFLEKEPWVVDTLIMHYLSSQSSKAADLIVKCRSEHDRVSIEFMSIAVNSNPFNGSVGV